MVTQEIHEKVQEKGNAHSAFWVRILRVGDKIGEKTTTRITSNMVVQDCTLAPLYGLRKDHKSGVDTHNEPPIRPVCGAVVAYSRKLTHIISYILNEVWKDVKSVCLNTEEMLSEFKQLNDNHITKDIIVGSADVNVLYPSLDVDFTVEKVCEVLYNSEIHVEGVDMEELGLYLALNLSEVELEKLGLLPYCPTRKTRRGRPPVITGCAMSDTRDKRFQPWLPPSRAPHELVVRKMLIEALRIVLIFIMKNHLYTFDNEIRLQSKGGPIGLQLTGVLAQLFMVWWDRELEDKLVRIGLKLWTYKRYVDDINNIMTPPKLGVRFDGNKLIEDERSLEEDQVLDADERTMRLFQSVANSIHPSIEVEIDCPSRHHDGKLPILDVKVWIEKRNRDGESQGENRVLHEYYSK